MLTLSGPHVRRVWALACCLCLLPACESLTGRFVDRTAVGDSTSVPCPASDCGDSHVGAENLVSRSAERKRLAGAVIISEEDFNQLLRTGRQGAPSVSRQIE